MLLKNGAKKYPILIFFNIKNTHYQYININHIDNQSKK